MPRTYIRKGIKNKWSDEQLKAAMAAVSSKQLRPEAAARKFSIPASTLRDHLSGKSKRRYGGRGTILTPDEEKEIERVCQVMQELGFPLTKEFVSVALRDYLAETGRHKKLKDGMPTTTGGGNFSSGTHVSFKGNQSTFLKTEHRQHDLK